MRIRMLQQLRQVLVPFLYRIRCTFWVRQLLPFYLHWQLLNLKILPNLVLVSLIVEQLKCNRCKSIVAPLQIQFLLILGLNYYSFTFYFNRFLQILFKPIEILILHMRKNALQILNLVVTNTQICEKFFNRTNSPQDNILTIERIFPKENLESCLLLMLIAQKIRIRTSELIQITGKQIGLMKLLLHRQILYYNANKIHLYINSYLANSDEESPKQNNKIKLDSQIHFKFHDQHYIIRMSKVQFPTQTFKNSLLQTKKIKSNLKPFIQEYSKGNMQIFDICSPWIFQSISILFHNLTEPSIDPLIKMNSMFAIRCIIDTCEYVPLALIQTYILPIIKKGAATDTTAPDSKRGLNFFVSNGKSQENIESYGYNYVKLCTQMIKVLAVMKPNKLYYSSESQDASDYALAAQQISLLIKHPEQKLVFFKDNPANLNTMYSKKVREFQQKSQAYSKFVQIKFQQQLKAGFRDNILDIRQLLKSGDGYIIDDVLQIAGDLIIQVKSCNIIKQVILFISSIVTSGNYHVMFFMHENQGIKQLVRQVISIQHPKKSLDRGQLFAPNKKGSSQQKKTLYIQFLRALELWSSVYTKNSIKNNKELSKIAKYYKKLKEQYKFEFPNNPLLEKEVKQTEKNYQKNKYRNEALRNQAIGQINQQQDDSIILSNLKSQHKIADKSKIKEADLPSKQQSDKSIEKQKQEIKPSSKKLNQSPIKQTPHSNTNDEELCRIKIKSIEEGLADLTTNQRNLPQNMKNVLKNLKDLSKLVQEGNIANEEELQKYMTRQIQLQNQFERISSIYQDYKVNKIDFVKFCNKVKPQASSLKQLPSKQNIDESMKTQNKLKSQEVVKQSIVVELPQESQRTKLQSKANAVHTSEHSIKQKHEKQPISNIKVQQIVTYQKQVIPKPNMFKQQQVNYQGIERNLPKDEVSRKQIIIKSNNFVPSHKEIQKSNINGSQKKSERYIINAPQQQQHNNKQQSRMQFSRSQFSQSRYTNTIKSHIQQENPQKQNYQNKPYTVHNEIKPFQQPYEVSSHILGGQQIVVESDTANKQFYRKFSNNKQEQSKNQYQPVTYSNQQQEHSYILSPIKNQQMRIDGIQQPNYHLINDNQFIQGPSLNPLSNSYHDFSQIQQQTNKNVKSFKEAINNNSMLIKNNKNQNLFWLQTQSGNLIKTVNNNQKKSRVSSKINVPQLLEERSKKHEVQLKLLEQSKQMRIKQLEHKVYELQRQKSTISQELKARQLQIRSIRQNSQLDGQRSKSDQFSLIDDQNFLMKKLAQANMPQQNQKRLSQSLKSQSRILATGQLINTKVFAKYFEKFSNEKSKKVHMKNKQLLYKDAQIQIGYMSHLEGKQYKVTCFITPEQDFTLEQVYLGNMDNLKIQHNLRPGLKIEQKKQEKVSFVVTILSIPYIIPEVQIKFKMRQSKRIQFVLPCAFHKFFTIHPLNQTKLNQYFESGNIIRGEQIPYSKKILKNLDLLQDFLPQILKLNKGLANSLGQICFGGEASYKACNFPLKISVKPNQFLYIQAIDKNNQADRRIIDFYIATLNHFLMKDISWG